GESEAVFTFLLGGALLVWHWGYSARWPAAVTWSASYFLAALAALDKGPQAPVYLIAVTTIFLAVRRDWKFLFSPAQVAGFATFALVVGAWQVPFMLRTDWEAVADIWSGLARDRFHFKGLVGHLLTYPWETLGCLLPWSPLLALYCFEPFRRSLGARRPHVLFLATAVCVTYPTLWLSAHARGRYFMPLYPCLAVLAGVVIERCAAAARGSDDRRAWHWFLRGVCVAAIGGALLLGGATVFPWGPLEDVRQPPLFMALFCVAAGATVWLLWYQSAAGVPTNAPRWLQQGACYGQRLTPTVVLLLIVALLGVTYDGVFINLRLNKANDLTPVMAELRDRLPAGARLVSFGPISHRFAYFYGQPIREFDWPESFDDVTPEATYFCFDLHQGDSPLKRANGRGRRWARTLGTLPFAWEQIENIPCDPIRRNRIATTVIVGRIVGPGEQSVPIAREEDDDAAKRR
ncbi:MAG TPA: hypothetical protein VG433_03205, partial [Pirellulales bacterium]|nr:hypothetical protein [Pirellulales bacterium]